MGHSIGIKTTIETLLNGDYRIMNSANHAMVVIKSNSSAGQFIAKHLEDEMTLTISIDGRQHEILD